MRLLILALAAALAAPAAAQVVPADFPDPNESMADRNNRQLEERHLGFLSRLYGQSTLEVGPSLGGAAPILGTAVEGGYRLPSGDAVALSLDLRSELARDPLSGALATDQGVATVAVGYVLTLDRHSPAFAEGMELELGAGVSSGAIDGTVLEVTPRYAIPLGGVTSLPVGLHASYGFGDRVVGASPLFVGVSVGMRYGYVSDRRLVLE
jgi:hypothetical protein